MRRSRKLYQLSVAMLLLLGFTPLQSQSIDERPALPNEQVAASFANPRLSLEQEQAFEQRAQQIIREFIDYYNLLRDAELDAELRAVLQEELTQLLYYPDLLLQLNGQASKTAIDQIDFKAAPAMELREINLLQTDSSSGKPVWHYQVQLMVGNRVELAKVELLVYRQFKAFGSRVREVWEVALLAWGPQ